MAQAPLLVSTISIACQMQFARFKGLIIFYKIVLRKSIYYGREITFDLGFMRMILKKFYLSEPENLEMFKEVCLATRKQFCTWQYIGVSVLDSELCGGV